MNAPDGSKLIIWIHWLIKMEKVTRDITIPLRTHFKCVEICIIESFLYIYEFN